MKKLLFGASALTILFAASCKKSDSSSSDNTFKFKGNTYTATTVAKASQSGMTMLTATDAKGAYVAFMFTTAPTADGSFKVGGDVTSADNAVYITAGSTLTESYSSSGHDNVSATLKMNGGKMTISVPDVWVVNDNGTDSTKLSAINITEK